MIWGKTLSKPTVFTDVVSLHGNTNRMFLAACAMNILELRHHVGQLVDYDGKPEDHGWTQKQQAFCQFQLPWRLW